MSNNPPRQPARKPFSASDLESEYVAVRRQTERLIEPLSDEDCAAQSMPEASPAKWHLAHTSWFFETFLLGPRRSGHEASDERFKVLFNSYYNGVGEQFARPQRGLLTRPSMAEIKRYRARVDEGMLALLGSRLSAAELDLVELGLHHEQQHQELLLTDVKHLFAQNPLWPAYRAPKPVASVESSELRWLTESGGLRSIGHRGGAFAFDNEGPAHQVWLAPYELASRLVTNREFLAFMEDGGYERPELWLADGWVAVQECGWRAPAYWRRSGAEWRYFTLQGDRRVDLDAPVCHVSFYEAEAFARWAEARLPTEFEWESVASRLPVRGNFVDGGSLQPLGCARGAESVPAQMFGDVWEWTRSDYAPYPGYTPAAGAVGEYNGKFMSGQYVLRGGSCATPASHVRATYRNFFPPRARWQFSGIRLARDRASVALGRIGSDEGKVEPRFYQVGSLDSSAQIEALTAGLVATPPTISPKFFYDFLGSKIFESITALPEYYLTRAEAEIFEASSAAIGEAARQLLGGHYQMIELGAGSCEKAAKLLASFAPRRFVAIDVSAEFLRQQITSLQQRFPAIEMIGVGMDFSKEVRMPSEVPTEPTLWFYPGSSLGNFEPATRERLLRQLRGFAPRSALLLGIDLVKDSGVLEAAYDDALGVTASFNLNVLNHVNGLLGADFNARDWRHVALFNSAQSRVEMHLEARRAVTVRWSGGQREFSAGERIKTEHSHKWSREALSEMLERSGFEAKQLWTDPAGLFCVVLAVSAGD